MTREMRIGVVELRNYLLKPGARDRFIDYFERHFVASQNAAGGFVLGAYKIEREPDRFFWLRGFAGMRERSRFLPAFYGGAHWRAFGPAANEMMLEWHRAHLLKPLGETVAADFLEDRDSLAVDFYLTDAVEALIEAFPSEEKSGKTDASFWIGEMTENDFPRLPVIQNENLVVKLSGCADRAKLKSCEIEEKTKKMLVGHEQLILSKAFSIQGETDEKGKRESTGQKSPNRMETFE